jgi:hypothetical protein
MAIVTTIIAVTTIVRNIKPIIAKITAKVNKIGVEDANLPELSYTYSQNLSYGLYESNAQSDIQRRLYYDVRIFLRYKYECLMGRNVSLSEANKWISTYMDSSNISKIDPTIASFISTLYTYVSETFRNSAVGRQLEDNHIRQHIDGAGWILITSRIRYWMDNIKAIAASIETNGLLKPSSIPVGFTTSHPLPVGSLESIDQSIDNDNNNIVPLVIGGGILLTKVI